MVLILWQHYCVFSPFCFVCNKHCWRFKVGHASRVEKRSTFRVFKTLFCKGLTLLFSFKSADAQTLSAATDGNTNLHHPCATTEPANRGSKGRNQQQAELCRLVAELSAPAGDLEVAQCCLCKWRRLLSKHGVEKEAEEDNKIDKGACEVSL